MSLGQGGAGFLRAFLQLTKIRISAASAFTVIAGYSAHARGLRWEVLPAVAGTLLMAMAASAFNEVQEGTLDGRMNRTKDRPVPSGHWSPAAAGTLAALLGVAGFLVLRASHGWRPAALGLLALAWYDGVYTPLKRHSAFAAVPGSLIGALPPAIGWVAAGGSLWDPALLGLCMVLFLWQVPHFWLLFRLHAEGYAQAGFPTLSRHFAPRQLDRLTFAWIGVTAMSAISLPLLGTLRSLPSTLVLGLASGWMVWKASSLLLPQADARPARSCFVHINLFALALVVAVILDPYVAAG